MILEFYINYTYYIFHNMETITMYLSEAVGQLEKTKLTQKSCLECQELAILLLQN